MESFYQQCQCRHFPMLWVMVQAKLRLLGHKVTFPTFATCQGRKWRLLEKFPTFADFFGRSLLLQTAHATFSLLLQISPFPHLKKYVDAVVAVKSGPSLKRRITTMVLFGCSMHDLYFSCMWTTACELMKSYIKCHRLHCIIPWLFITFTCGYHKLPLVSVAVILW